MFGLITLITALSLAVTAAWFAIAGIMAVFAGAPIPALIMGSVIEAGKIVAVSWVYRNWKERTNIKFVLLPLILIAMLLTSMGIFGFLSKAHIEQSAPVGNNALQIERLDQRILSEGAKITDAESVIFQLDETVSTLIEYDKISGPDGARAVRDGQQDQRDLLAQTIRESQSLIDGYEDQKLILNQELQNLELEVGPIKYIAELVYEDPESSLEDAVRIVIIAFIFVFDPMAIILLMAANHTLMQRSAQKPKPKKVDDDSFLDDRIDFETTAVPSSDASFVPATPNRSTNTAPTPQSATPPSRPGKFVSKDRLGQKYKNITGDKNDK